MKRADAASLIACGGFVAWILAGINPGNSQPWISIEGFRAEASHDGLTISDEDDAREYTPLSPARDGWVLGNGQISGLARFEDFPFARSRPGVEILDLLLSTMGAGRPHFDYAGQAGGRFEARRWNGAFRVRKLVSLPEGAQPRRYLHVLAPAGTLIIHLDGLPVTRRASDGTARDEIPEKTRITIVSLLTGRGWLLERPGGSRAYLNTVSYQIELESAFELAGRRASSTLTISPFRRSRG